MTQSGNFWIHLRSKATFGIILKSVTVL